MSEDPGEIAEAPPGFERRPAPEPDAKPVALDTDDTRGWHFKRILRSKWTIYGGAAATIIVGVGAWLGAESPAVGGGAAGGTVLLVLLIAFWAAIAAAARDFFVLYADQRGLALHEGRGNLPAVTPLLRKGDRRYCENAMTGRLPGDFDGTLARFTYEVDTTDSDGDRQTSYYKFNVIVAHIPESASHIRELYCERRAGFRFLDGAEDAFRKTKRLELESEALDKRYEIFHHAEDTGIYMRELFTPRFIVWLADEAPKDFSFEFCGGTLCVSTKGHYDDAVSLDALCEAAAQVRHRLLSEATETLPAQSPPSSEPA